jgi:hypothetical protein
MAQILVDRLVSTSGSAPVESYDSDSQASYFEWRQDDEAQFAATVSPDYRTGSNFFLRLQETSPSSSANHAWLVNTALLRPGVYTTGGQVVSETFAQEYVSSGTPGQLTSRKFPVTGAEKAGYVAGMQIQAQDVLSFLLKRVAASANEDPDSVRTIGICLEVYADSATSSNCAGRVGRIADAVRDLFNESTGGFLPDGFILRSMNRCLQDLAQEDYWCTETWIPSVAGSYRIDLPREIPDYQRLHQVYFNGQHCPMTPLGSFQEYEELKVRSIGSGCPEHYVVQNNTLFVWPAPSTNQESGFCLYHSYLPEELTCSDVNPNPSTPKAHDSLFVYYVLKEAFLRDRHAPGADVKFQEYSMLYEKEKHKILGEGSQPNLAVRSYR